jgi:hypothetical protein
VNPTEQTSADPARRRVRPDLRIQVFGATGTETAARGETDRDTPATRHVSAREPVFVTFRHRRPTPVVGRSPAPAAVLDAIEKRTLRRVLRPPSPPAQDRVRRPTFSERRWPRPSTSGGCRFWIEPTLCCAGWLLLALQGDRIGQLQPSNEQPEAHPADHRNHICVGMSRFDKREMRAIPDARFSRPPPAPPDKPDREDDDDADPNDDDEAGESLRDPYEAAAWRMPSDAPDVLRYQVPERECRIGDEAAPRAEVSLASRRRAFALSAKPVRRIFAIALSLTP